MVTVIFIGDINEIDQDDCGERKFLSYDVAKKFVEDEWPHFPISILSDNRKLISYYHPMNGGEWVTIH